MDKLAHVVTKAVDGYVTPGVYNVVEHNMSINEIASRIRVLYPKLDIIHANFNIRMKDVITALPCRICDQVPPSGSTFEEELLAFKSHFSF